MMSAKRFNQIMVNQTEAAIKVYNAVPIQEDWNAAQVQREMVRSGITVSPAGVGGCLDSLKRSGLIKENRDGFRRVPIRAAKIALDGLKDALEEVQQEEEPEETMRFAPAPATKEDVVDMLGRLSQQLNVMAERHAKEMADLAHLIADAAVEVQAEREAGEEDLRKYRQLKLLLA